MTTIRQRPPPSKDLEPDGRIRLPSAGESCLLTPVVPSMAVSPSTSCLRDLKNSLVLFNLHRAMERGRLTQQPLIVVEGFFDCMKVWQGGFNCVALMGCEESAAQEELLVRHASQVLLMLDGDGGRPEG